MQSPACTLAPTLSRLAQPAPDLGSGEQTSSEGFRQLRHQTKNTLQRLLEIIAGAPELNGHGADMLRDSLQHRILVTADLSDALFGFTRDPGDMRGRLRQLTLGLVELLAEDSARITVTVDVEGACPACLHGCLVRVAHELIGNAVKHGMYQRLLGSIDISLRSTGIASTLTVTDDGWGCDSTGQQSGEGLSLVRSLLHPHEGVLRIARHAERTVSTATITHAHVSPLGQPARTESVRHQETDSVSSVLQGRPRGRALLQRAP